MKIFTSEGWNKVWWSMVIPGLSALSSSFIYPVAYDLFKSYEDNVALINVIQANVCNIHKDYFRYVLDLEKADSEREELTFPIPGSQRIEDLTPKEYGKINREVVMNSENLKSALKILRKSVSGEEEVSDGTMISINRNDEKFEKVSRLLFMIEKYARSTYFSTMGLKSKRENYMPCGD